MWFHLKELKEGLIVDSTIKGTIDLQGGDEANGPVPFTMSESVKAGDE